MWQDPETWAALSELPELARNTREGRTMSGWLSAGLGWANSAEGWIALGTLTVLEIVLGIDNIVFISILAGKLRQEDRARAQESRLVAGDVHPHRCCCCRSRG